MKHYIRPLRSLNKSILMLILLGMTGSMLHAQEVNFNTNYPRITAGQEPLIVLGDAADFDVFFTVLTADIPAARIEISLPRHVDYVTGSATTVGGAAVTWGAVGNGGNINAATGKTVILTITSDGNKLLQNAAVQLRIKVQALCKADREYTAV